jgi:RNA polymerase sigma factor (sigma-70 family)
MEAATLTPLARGRRLLARDEQLVAATRLGDDRAFETLYHRYHRRIAAYVVGMVKDHQRAEDVTQEVFLSALRRMRSTDREIVFKPWIYEIAKNACIDQFRRARRTDEVSYDADSDDGGVPPLVTGGPGPDEAVESRKRLADLCGAFGGLSDSHHQILVLRELEGRSYQEIGERMHMTRPAVESTLFRARKRLSEEYGELVSGERCQRVQAIIASADAGSLGVRDRRTMARHLSHCQPCRRAAALAGLEQFLPARVGVRAKIAAALPLPAFLRDRWLGVAGSHHAASAVDGGGGAGAGLAAWLHASAPIADNASGWVKAVATAATVAAAGVGAGAVVSHGDGGTSAGVSSAPAAAHAAHAARTVRPAAARAAAAPSASAVRPASTAGRAGRAARPRPHRSTTASTPAAVTPTDGLGQRASVAPATPASTTKRASGPSGPSSGSAVGTPAPTQTQTQTQAPTASTPADPVVKQAKTTVAAVTEAVQGTLTTATQALPPAPAIPSIPSVGDTQATVPTLGDVTQKVGETVDQTLQNAQGAVNDVTNGLQGAVTGLGNLSSGG